MSKVYWPKVQLVPTFELKPVRNGRSIALIASGCYYSTERWGVTWGPKGGLRGGKVYEAYRFIRERHLGDPAAEEILLNLLPVEQRPAVVRVLLRMLGSEVLGVEHPQFSAQGRGYGDFVILCEAAGRTSRYDVVRWSGTPHDFDFAGALDFIAERRHPQGPSAKDILDDITPDPVRWELHGFVKQRAAERSQGVTS